MPEDTSNSGRDERSATNDDVKRGASGYGGAAVEPLPPREVGGRGGPDPTRYGDWEKNGRCIDF